MYIRTLKLAEHCEFGDKRDEHMRDRLIMGIKDRELFRRFKFMADLTLTQDIEQVHQAEEITKKVSLQANQTESQLANVNVVRRR